MILSIFQFFNFIQNLLGKRTTLIKHLHVFLSHIRSLEPSGQVSLADFQSLC